MASVATFTRVLRRFRESTNHAISAQRAHRLWQEVAPSMVTLDLDSAVLMRYRTQDGAAESSP